MSGFARNSHRIYACVDIIDKVLETAFAYIDLGLLEDAWAEFDELPPELRSADEVMEMKLMLCERMAKWESGSELSDALVKSSPDRPRWWLWSAKFARKTQTVEVSLQILITALQQHPTSSAVLYRLACYSCALGQSHDAKKLLQKAFLIDPDLKNRALDEPDLRGIV